MKTKYQFIHFDDVTTGTITKKYSCKNNNSNEELGVIKWYPGWRQYCYFPTVQAVYSKGCLNDITDFINQLKV